MATPSVVGLDRFLGHVRVVQATAKERDRTVVGQLALASKGVILTAASGEIPNRRLSRFAKGKGIVLGASYRLGETDGKSSATLYATPPGPWGLLEKGSQAHPIGGRKGRRGFLGSSDRKFAAAGPVNHPPTAPKHTWTHASASAIAASKKTFERVQRQQYVKFFAG